MKFNRFISFLVITALFLSACSRTSSPEAEANLKEALNNLNDAQTAQYSYDFNVEGNTPDGDFTMDMKLSGAMDASENPKLSLVLDGSGDFSKISVDGMPADMQEMLKKAQEVAGELRLIDESLYMNLTKAPEVLSSTTPFVQTIANQWWKMTLPPEALESYKSINKLGEKDVDESTLTEDEKELRNFLRNMEYLQNIQTAGSEDGMLKYEAELNKEGLINIMKNVSPEGQTPTEEEIQEFRKALDSVSLITFWVDETEKIVKKVNGTIDMKFGEGTEQEGMITAEFTSTFEDINEPVTVEVPENAKVFDPAMLFGGLMQPGVVPVPEEAPATP